MPDFAAPLGEAWGKGRRRGDRALAAPLTGGSPHARLAVDSELSARRPSLAAGAWLGGPGHRDGISSRGKVRTRAARGPHVHTHHL